jgi:tripartite-type tricarboxylate transporter receptor subunit TctC
MNTKTYLFLLSMLICAPVGAQSWPQRALRLVVPNAPGGGSDTVARVLAERLTPALGQQIVVENRAGAGGRQAAEYVAKSAADGYTLLLGTGATLITARALYGRLGYDPEKSFAPVALLANTAYLLVVHPSVPAGTVRQLIGLAKAQPGALNYSSSGAGSPSHLATELFCAMAGTRLTHIPYKGSAPGTLAVMQGESALMFSNFIAALPHVKSNRVRSLGISTARRSVLAPEMPTIQESGLPGYEVLQYYSVVAPAGTAGNIIQRLHDEITKHFRVPATQRQLASQGAEIQVSTPAELAIITAREIAKWSALIHKLGIQSE